MQSEDIVVGTPIAERNHADLDNIIGMFVNTLALKRNTIRAVVKHLLNSYLEVKYI